MINSNSPLQPGPWFARRPAFVALWLFAMLWTNRPAVAAPPPETEPPHGQVDAADDPEQLEADPRIEQLEQLRAGTLDASVDERTLFDVSVDLAVALAKPAAESGEQPVQQSARLTAYRSWFDLPPEERSLLLENHAAKRLAVKAEREAAGRVEDATSRAKAKAKALRQLLAGELDPMHDTEPDLVVDLLDPFDSPLVAHPDHPELAAALADLADVRTTIAELDPARRVALLEQHAQAAKAAAEPEIEPEIEPENDQQVEKQREIDAFKAEANTAARAQEAALEEARKATSEVKRQISKEEARLQGLNQTFALLDSELTQRTADADSWDELALEWSRRVRELEESALYGSEREASADPMYEELRNDLTQTRAELRANLATVRDGWAIPEVGSELSGRAADAEPEPNAVLRKELEAERAALIKRADAETWALTQRLRDNVVDMNAARLELLKLASSGLRSTVTGFGRGGVEQVKREIDQISLEVSFLALKLRQLRRDLGTRAREATIPLILGSIKFLVLALGFWGWRKSAPRMMAQVREWVAESNIGSARLRETLATILWFLDQVRRPLEVLLALWVGLRFIGSLEAIPELGLLWIIARWTLIGLAVILFVDAVAKREAQFATVQVDTSALRISSLRLVGLSIIAVGLLLSLTAAMVGKGAIYRWVLSTCWLLVVPIAALLVARWRDTVFEHLSAQADSNALTRWAATRHTGLVSIPAAALGAAYLLGKGVGGWVMRQLSALDSTRRLLAYLFRREVARQAASQIEDKDLSPVSPDRLAAFDPERLDRGQVNATQEAIEQVLARADSPRATLSAVIGERGAGKSTVLATVGAGVGDPIVLQCPESGFTGLLGRLAQSLGVPADQVAQSLRARGPTVVLIDDMQRIVVPAVGGLEGLDAFTSLTREVGGQVSWVAAFESAAWSYIRRARGERVFFEQIVVLPKWSEEQLAALIDHRLAQAEITVSYEELTMPRQTEAPLPNQGDRSRAAYLRLLWDYSNGNPGATLDAFRRSLFEDGEGTVTVRLFREPDAEVIESLSLSILFVLRACVQLERASIGEIVDATQLEEAEVADAIRFCVARNYLEPTEDLYRLSWDWYRTITTVLVRQHLLPKL